MQERERIKDARGDWQDVLLNIFLLITIIN